MQMTEFELVSYARCKCLYRPSGDPDRVVPADWPVAVTVPGHGGVMLWPAAWVCELAEPCDVHGRSFKPLRLLAGVEA